MLKYMFISVVLDPGSIDSSRALSMVLTHFGFKKVQRAVWESTVINSGRILQLKREMDRVTDYYDKIRMYQFPVDGLFEITFLSQKKWRRCLIKPELVHAKSKE